ncbi:MAG: HAMP domain-containing sensor histidine kinase [Flavobacteriaceae bacterium]
MKFNKKINRNYISLILILFVVISSISYVVISKVILLNAKEKLAEKEFMIKNEITKSGVLPQLFPLYETQKIKDSFEIKSKYKQIYLKDNLENEVELYYEYQTIVKIKDTYYLLKIRQSSVENEDLLLAIILPLLTMLFLAFTFSYVINKRQIASVWKKFEYNLNQIKKISLQHPKELKLLTTNIDEFDSLNQVVTQLINKLQTDYNNLKEFAENASHELQTPLAVILMSLEEVMQTNLSESVHAKIYQSYQEIKKLTKLNKNLLLLSKIDNDQFTDVEKVDLSDLIKQKLDLFKTIIASKNIKVETDLKAMFKLNMSPFLANILINNLISNAINHNINKGAISVRTTVNSFEITNTTNGQSLNLDKLFKRFYKVGTDSNSVGLGLALVKKITDASGLKLQVSQSDSKLTFSILI